ncbi:pectate lyase [Streptomyces calidiresistens]|uniref:Pectate lyase n=1 Tax=Streptomyces calidiresistens TaxID=1485586 RepID=A0A7W3XX44_9ACTN|nr:pectate lyase [Streptomyces calidiresistens]MBB0230720.1 pectate lyase [Streptomyces calidiresistens]
MRVSTKVLAGACAVTMVAITAPVAMGASGDKPDRPDKPGKGAGYELGHEVLGPRDGWGAHGAGTSGGASAAPENIHTVTNRAELLAALGPQSNDTPKIIHVKGTIDMNVDEAGNPLECADFADPEYSLEAYLEAYDPETWGMTDRPSGPLEDARVRSYRNQSQQIYRLPSNTTLVGLGKDARIEGAAMYIRDVRNVIVRNITFAEVEDCFPQWDPRDGSSGNWNSEYDAIWVHGSTNVWLDHNTFKSGGRPDTEYFGRPFMRYDGSVDITRGSDLVTVSWNHYDDYDKGMLIGGGDGHSEDIGKLRVTYHHNLFENVLQRSPRVRRGQVHVYNNHYLVNDEASGAFDYAWGVGLDSMIHAENNYFEGPIGPDRIAYRWNGTDLYEKGTYLNGFGKKHLVDVVAEHNAARPGQEIGTDVGWTPWLYERIDPVAKAVKDIEKGAGAGRL